MNEWKPWLMPTTVGERIGLTFARPVDRTSTKPSQSVAPRSRHAIAAVLAGHVEIPLSRNRHEPNGYKHAAARRGVLSAHEPEHSRGTLTPAEHCGAFVLTLLASNEMLQPQTQEESPKATPLH